MAWPAMVCKIIIAVSSSLASVSCESGVTCMGMDNMDGVEVILSFIRFHFQFFSIKNKGFPLLFIE
jgi:hypothetical protein